MNIYMASCCIGESVRQNRRNSGSRRDTGFTCHNSWAQHTFIFGYYLDIKMHKSQHLVQSQRLNVISKRISKMLYYLLIDYF